MIAKSVIKAMSHYGDISTVGLYRASKWT